jgi:hypothetical protein
MLCRKEDRLDEMTKSASKELAKKIETRLFKLLLWPVCRAYARHLGDKPADARYRFLCSLQFWRVYRFWPDLVQPRLFSEKLWSRMLHVRDPLFTLICDKLRVREYVTKKVGGECLIPLLWSGEEPKNIPFDDLPSQFVMKANHGSGYNIIVTDKTKLDQASAKRKLKKWLGENFCSDKYLGSEWGYKNIKPHITIELFIGDKDKSPADYKFYCFSGRVELLTLHVNRPEGVKSITLNRSFERYRFGPDFKQYEINYSRPANFEAMVQLAEALSEGFDFMRVDLYSTENRIYFGEFTPYPVGVSKFYSFDIASLDPILGEKWKMKGSP